MSADADIRVLLVDDQPLIRMGFRMVLDGEPGITVVGEADDGAAGAALAAELRPDVVMMDVRMSGVDGMDGIEATSLIVRRCPESRVIILTTFDLDEYAFAGLRAGASGFLLKNARPAELIQAIRTVAAGDAVVAPRITRRMLEIFGNRLPDGAPDVVPQRDERLSVLTERELEIFAAMGKGLNNGEIARSFFLSESTVKTHVGHILLKLGLRDRVHAVVLGYETGVVAAGESLAKAADRG
ncbi:response regulator transcription factor [Arthrobacter sp. EH-1B-1]|uniref:Response regulator transcription factor n=1 Tax=Arthrobacter vasquezii TaxID=2977629 RepID=A0ABT6CQ65_9MICC|nr:response regulator transcription factor [Arthrobacter vasquezii]MDF9276208.1 response regulator transcription factor [Arthrobacter vasquezii]